MMAYFVDEGSRAADILDPRQRKSLESTPSVFV
jgi:hypothetical protein